MAAEYRSPSEYIDHHLAFFTKPAEGGGFWSINVDSVITSVLLGLISLGFIWWVVRGATAGVPGRRQAFVEWLFTFVDDQVKGIFHHGDRNKFVAPAALTVFIWVVLMNAMDFLPAQWLARMDEFNAGMSMVQAFPGIWLPGTVDFQGALTSAAGPFDLTFRLEYHDYRQPDVKSKVTIPKDK